MSSSGPVATNGQRTALGVLLLGVTAAVMAGSVLTPAVALVRGDLGVGGATADVMLTVHGLCFAGVGVALARWGARGLLAGGLLLCGIAGGAGLVTVSDEALAAVRFVLATGAEAVLVSAVVTLFALRRGPGLLALLGALVGGSLAVVLGRDPITAHLVAVPFGIAALMALPPLPFRRSFPADAVARRGAGVSRVLQLLCRQPALLGAYALLCPLVGASLVTTGALVAVGLVALVLRMARPFGATSWASSSPGADRW